MQRSYESASKPTVLNYAKGGIGNQLFQHVFARSLAKKLGADMVTDISYFAADPYGFQPSVWSLAPGARSANVAEFVGAGCYLLKEGQLQSLQDFAGLPADARALVLSGYWQREALLDPDIVRETYAQLAARAEALVANEMVLRMKSCAQPVAVHIRRRDYAHMGICKESYYLAAIEHLQSSHADAELFVFSDEPNYARHLMVSRGLAFTPVASGSDLGDLFLMSLCRHFVIANSSYSWWAAYFAEVRGGLIFCPKEWVTIDATPSPCPARWLQITDAIKSFELDEVEVEEFRSQLQQQLHEAAR